MLGSHQRIDRATGVSINLLSGGEVMVNACSISIKDDKLDIDKKLTGLDDVGLLKKHLPEKAYIALNLCGKGILHKRIEKVTLIDKGNFGQILPNANYDDFYVQQFDTTDRSFISVVRKTDADEHISLLKKMGFIPLLLSLGPFPVQHIVQQINVYEGDIVFDGHTIVRDGDSSWSEYIYRIGAVAQFPIKIESETIDEKLLISYANAFQLALATKLSPIKADVPLLDRAFDDTIAALKLKVKGFVVLTVFFVLLLVNFLIFSWLNTENVELTDKVSRSAQNSSTLQDIGRSVEAKESLLKNLGWDGGVKKSVMIDQLAAMLPADLSWRELSINPLDKSVSQVERTLKFMDGNIKVVGHSERIIPVNEWIARIKTYKWVKAVQLESYTFNTELNSGQFTVLINY